MWDFSTDLTCDDCADAGYDKCPTKCYIRNGQIRECFKPSQEVVVAIQNKLSNVDSLSQGEKRLLESAFTISKELYKKANAPL